MSEADPWTVKRLLTWTTDYLREHGSLSPRLDAELLLAHARGCERIELYTSFDEVPDEPTRSAFRQLVKQRAESKPVAYLVGHREFYSLSFEVNEHVLIPRPETEFLVLAALDLMKGVATASRTLEVVDVGTGSGAIAVAIATQQPHCRVTAIDISEGALDIAARNVAKHGVGARVQVVHGDVLSDLPLESRFDLVVSNPPYIAESEADSMSRDVLDFEPHLALFAGTTGTEVIERLVPQAAERLVAGGWLLMEISPMIEAKVLELIEADGRFDTPETTKDLAGLARVVQARRATESR